MSNTTKDKAKRPVLNKDELSPSAGKQVPAKNSENKPAKKDNAGRSEKGKSKSASL